jgi:two-component system response regulator QseB
MRVLLIEDDAMIGEAVRTGLRQDGFTVDWVREAEAGDAAIKAEAYALLLLDLGLPRKSGLDWLRELRRRGIRIPVLILTARRGRRPGSRTGQRRRRLFGKTVRP